MNTDKFKNIELKYMELKAKLEKGEITSEQVKQQLKKMMILDEKGHYWMIGGKSGKWYTYDGTEWKEDDPFKTEPVSQEETPQTRFYPQQEIDLSGTETQQTSSETIVADLDYVLCKSCRAKIPANATYCSLCGTSQKEGTPVPSHVAGVKETEILIKSINLISLIFLLGGFGLIIGVILGASFGIFDIGGDLIYQFPRMLQETRGKIQGGVIFAVMGGIGGFVAFAFMSIIITAIYNAVAYLFGGIRLKVKM
jgi:hypothetical protein